MTAPEHPGARLKLELEKRSWAQKELVEILERPAQMVSEIIGGKKEITRQTAAQLAAALDTEPEFWLVLQDNWALHHLTNDAAFQKSLEEIRARAEEMANRPPRHNHRASRDIKPQGECPACDVYWDGLKARGMA
jgi:HTH-type transcriptional regulator/antitoxin HigA